MSNQNRFLLPHQPASAKTACGSSSLKSNDSYPSISQTTLVQENEYQVDIDFDSYWEEEARNPHRNRIRIGRQYQATVPPILKPGEKDSCRLEDLEILSFCPERSAKVTDAELDHYFTVAKSLNLFASLVETRSLLGRDVTIADLNRIRQKEGLSLASVIQPGRQAAVASSSQNTPSQIQNTTLNSPQAGHHQSSPQKSPPSLDSLSKSVCPNSSVTSPREVQVQENIALNQPLMKALSHFISLHHPCRHDNDCKKLLKDIPLEDVDTPAPSITAGNLRGSPSKDMKAPSSRSRSRALTRLEEDSMCGEQPRDQSGITNSTQQLQPQSRSTYGDWTHDEVELFAKAIEICGKNFGSIKKEFLPSKSVRSIVEYYYIGSRDLSESKKKPSQIVETGDSCSGAEKTPPNNNNNGQGGGGSDCLQQSEKNATASDVSDLNHSTPSTGRTSTSGNGSKTSNNYGKATSDAFDSEKQTTPQVIGNSSVNCGKIYVKQNKTDANSPNNKSKSKNIDARMSVYNFDDEIKEETSPVRFECPRPGVEVRPLKAKPIMPNNSREGEASNSNVGSLKFFMDGQLVLKLNACQEQQEGSDKCHWVQSGNKLPTPSRQKRYSKRAANDRIDFNQNGTQSNSVVSSNNDDDLKNEHDLTSADEDSKESTNSFTNNMSPPKSKSFSASLTPKRTRTKTETSTSPGFHQFGIPHHQPSQQLTTPIDYKRLALSNRMKERSENDNTNNNPNAPLVSQASTMPWLQANSFAMAAALLGSLPFPTAADSIQNQIHGSPPNLVNMVTKPMDLSVEHNSTKPIQAPKPSRSRGKQKN